MYERARHGGTHHEAGTGNFICILFMMVHSTHNGELKSEAELTVETPGAGVPLMYGELVSWVMR